MRLADAKRLHAGDEVVDKGTGESIRVLSATVSELVPGQDIVMVEGVGVVQGYSRWPNAAVR